MSIALVCWSLFVSQVAPAAEPPLQAAPRRFDFGVIGDAPYVPADEARMAAVPVCVVWGDYFDSSPQWRRYRQLADAWLDGLERAGGSVTRLDLPAMGIAGNSHLPMMDRNNVRVAALVDAWIRGCAD